jgi:hypothetical protein
MPVWHIVWRKEGSLQERTIGNTETEAAKVWEEFRKTSPGGGVPVKPSFEADGLVTRVKNGEGRTLAIVVQEMGGPVG